MMAVLAWFRRSSLVGDERGAAMVEFALAIPLLLVLLTGMVDCAQLIASVGQANVAAHAGATYARKYGWSPSGIADAVANAAASHAQASPAPSLVAGCIIDGQLVSASGSTCPDGGPVGSFVLVTAEVPFTPLAPWPVFGSTDQLSARSMVQIR